MTDFQTGDECLVHDNCRQYPAQCLGCYFPEDALGPTQYIPRNKTIEHPLTTQRKAARATRRKEAKRSEASQRGKASRRKGQRVERDFAKLTGGQRIPLSGALRGNLSNDVALPAALGGLKVEVKARADSWKELYRWILDDIEKPDALILKADNKPYLVVQVYEVWAAGREASPVDLKKLGEAMRMLEEAVR